MSDKNGAILAALGSMIGYIGSEVSGPLSFERLLWPSRFYNDLTPWIAFKLALFMPLGGPIHRAALSTLDQFQQNHLYDGPLMGDMLGSAFFPDTTQVYYPQSGPTMGTKYKARNFLWMFSLNGAADRNTPIRNRLKPGHSRKTTCLLYHLKLDKSPDLVSSQLNNMVVVQEDRNIIRIVVGIFIGESIAILTAMIVGIVSKNYWLPNLLCVPVALKLLAFVFQVRRQNISTRMSDDLVRKFGDPDSAMLFKFESRNASLILIESPPRQFLPFVLHYGHPIRDINPQTTSILSQMCSDRAREAVSILIVYAFVLVFPAGLLSLIWLPDTIQYTWLGYQIYLIIIMHISRLARFGGAGRTEERISRHLRSGKTVLLRSQNGATVQAQLTLTAYSSVRDGTAALDRVVDAKKR